MKLANYIIAIVILLIAWSCEEDETKDNYVIPTEGNIFKVAVDVHSKTVDELGGKDVVETMLKTNFRIVSKTFNTSGSFNETHFIFDKLNVYESDLKTQLSASHDGQDIVLVIDCFSEDGDLEPGWYSDNKVVVLTDETADVHVLFSAGGVKYFTYAMSLARGGIDLSVANVKVEDNPVAAYEYVAEASVLNPDNSDNKWDDLNAALINLSATGDPVSIQDIIPDNINLIIQDTAQQGMQNVTVTVFPVRWGSGRVLEDSVFEGTTDTTGNISINSAFLVPDDIKGENEDYFANLFIRIEIENVADYFYLPLAEVLAAGVSGSTSYNKTKEFFVVTLESITTTRYTFDEQSDLFANSGSIGVTSTATYSSDAKHGTGAIELDGTQHLILDKDDKIKVGSNYSVSYWFKTTTAADGNNAFWTMSDWSGDTSDDPWVPGGLTFRYTADNINYDIGWEGGSSGSAVVADGQWHLLVTTVEFTDVDPVKGSGTIKMYLDGQLIVEGNNNFLDTYWSDDPSVVDDFVVKIGYSSSAGDAAAPFTGVIDDLRVFSDVLDVNKVYSLFTE